MNNELPTVKELIIVEGKYDKNTVLQTVRANVMETSGFGIFHDREKRNLIKAIAEKNGIIILTDSDSSGFVIRNHIKGFVDEKYIKTAYIPEIKGKERRKDHFGKEGLLGVEGMRPETIVSALTRAGATLNGEAPAVAKEEIKVFDLYQLGLTGSESSRSRKSALLESLGFPSKVSTKALLEILNCLYSREEFYAMMEELFHGN